MDLVKAVLLGAALIAGLFAIPVIIAVLVPALIFVFVVFVIWFIMKIFQEDPKPPP